MSHWSLLLWKSLVYLVASVRGDATMWVTAVSTPEDLSGRPKAALFLPFFSPEVAWLVSDSNVMTWKVVAMENGPSKTCLCWLFLMRGSLSSWQASGKEDKTGMAALLTLAFMRGAWFAESKLLFASLPSTSQTVICLCMNSKEKPSAWLKRNLCTLSGWPRVLFHGRLLHFPGLLFSALWKPTVAQSYKVSLCKRQ